MHRKQLDIHHSIMVFIELSFDLIYFGCFLGITFTDKPININERIHLKVVEVDETRQWCGSLAIGLKKE